MFRFNPYDRAPLRTLRVVEMDASAAERNVEHTVMWYEAYERFSQLIHNDQNAVKVKLQPGTVLVLDNTRVLHARLPFDVREFPIIVAITVLSVVCFTQWNPRKFCT